MTNQKEPREGWTLDSQGSSWAAESTYDDRVKRAQDKAASRSVRKRVSDLLSGGERARLGIKRDRG